MKKINNSCFPNCTLKYQVIDERQCIFLKKHESSAIKPKFIKHEELLYNIQQ